jgi:ribosomal protein L1
MFLKLNASPSKLYRRVELYNVINYSFSTAAAAVEQKVVKEPRPPSRRKEMMEQKFPVMNIHEAVATIKKLGWANFDETIEISVNMGLDPRKPNQSVKGIAKLPSGSGKKVRILVFANGNDAQEAKDAGADVVGSDDLIAKIQGGDVNFNTVIATPELMATVGRVGKVDTF